MINPDEIAAKLKMSFRPEKPLEFFAIPQMDSVAVIFYSSAHFVGITVDTPFAIVLTPVVAQALLSDLPMLRTLLEEAVKAPTKPPSVQ
jgi:hypothetical protein